MEINGKTVLITGATDGLGKILALNLAKMGCNLIIHGRNIEKIDSLITQIKETNPKINVETILCNLNKPETVAEAFDKVKSLDILINNAGVWAEGNTADASPEKVIELSNVNLLSYMLTTRVLLPVLQRSEFSQILNVSSIAGVEIPQGYSHSIYSAYSATKFGVQAFSEALAKEFGNTNLRVMGYYPGGMATNLFKKAGIDYKDGEPWMFDPQESVDAILFMLTRNPKVNVKRMDLINHLEQ